METNEEQVKTIKLSRDGSTSSEEEHADEAFAMDIRKVILLGDSETGKTSILIRFDQNRYNGSEISSTVGVGYATKVVAVNEDRVKLQIWDTAGQERFRSITRSYYRNADGMILVYDVTKRLTFDHIREWITEIGENTGQPVPIVIIGNKIDLVSERKISTAEGQALAENYSAKFFETSAKHGDCIDEAFISLARILKDTVSEKPTDDTKLVNSSEENKPINKCSC